MIDVRESTDKLKILIVDDSELNRELLAGMLGDEYEIYQVENGKKAIDILEENREQFKLVLLDINMPVMDGLEFSEKLLEKYPKCKVVIVTGFREFEYARKAIKLGVEEFLLKPINIKELAEVMNKLKNKLAKIKEEASKVAKLKERSVFPSSWLNQ